MSGEDWLAVSCMSVSVLKADRQFFILQYYGIEGIMPSMLVLDRTAGLN